MLSRQHFGRFALIAVSIVAAVALVVLGLSRVLARSSAGPTVHATTTAHVSATATATALPTPSYDSGQALSWSHVVFPTNAASFALTAADEKAVYACVPQAAGVGSSLGFWASRDRGVTWAHVSDLPTRQAGECSVVPD